MDKLKPCPFCGTEPVIRQWPGTNTLYIECINKKCKMNPSTGLQRWSKIEVHIEAWNRRVDDGN